MTVHTADEFIAEGKLKVTRRSPFTGKVNVKVLDVTRKQYNAWKDGAYIQVVMGHLSPDDREFILTGMTADDWDDAFEKEEHPSVELTLGDKEWWEED